MTVRGLVEPVAVCPPIFEVTVYLVIAEPPVLTGGVKVIVALVSPAVVVTLVGAPGAVAGTTGVTEVEAAEALEVPMAFVAVTVKV